MQDHGIRDPSLHCPTENNTEMARHKLKHPGGAPESREEAEAVVEHEARINT